MRGTFNTSNGQTQTLPSGYAPITGYTGHLNEDLTGLIYMKGRYYSPLWHRFINSDQGVDPASINQYAYVGGSPFMATDPSGMKAAHRTNIHCGDGRTVQVDSKYELSAEDRAWVWNNYCAPTVTAVINGGGDDSWWSSFFGGGGHTVPGGVGGLDTGDDDGNRKGPQAKTPQKECSNGNAFNGASGSMAIGRSNNNRADAQVVYAGAYADLVNAGAYAGVSNMVAILNSGGSFVLKTETLTASAEGGLWPSKELGFSVGATLVSAQFGFKFPGFTVYAGIDIGAGLDVQPRKKLGVTAGILGVCVEY
jgi:RHS repeat-associated protein